MENQEFHANAPARDLLLWGIDPILIRAIYENVYKLKRTYTIYENLYDLRLNIAEKEYVLKRTFTISGNEHDVPADRVIFLESVLVLGNRVRSR